jgi:hypothetical protein
MEAIKTKYKGVQFRSKLEARVAVFFNYYGLKWDYEPESFRLKNGQIYCPDFFLSDLDCFCEVKPIRDVSSDEFCVKIPNVTFLSNKEYSKIEFFEKRLCLIVGIPTDRNFLLYHKTNGKLDYDYVYPCFDTKLNRWRWWSCCTIDDYPRYGNIEECAKIARYYDFFNY